MMKTSVGWEASGFFDFAESLSDSASLRMTEFVGVSMFRDKMSRSASVRRVDSRRVHHQPRYRRSTNPIDDRHLLEPVFVPLFNKDPKIFFEFLQDMPGCAVAQSGHKNTLVHISGDIGVLGVVLAAH